MVVSLLPTKGNDDAAGIHERHMTLLKMAKTLDMRVVCVAADGASAELGAQVKMDGETSATCSPLISEPVPNSLLSIEFSKLVGIICMS